MSKLNETVVSLPKTWAAIKANFPDPGNKGLREAILASCLSSGASRCLGVALTTSGRACLDAVNQVSRKEFADAGFDKVVVGEGDPSIYGNGVVVAYLDQPI